MARTYNIPAEDLSHVTVAHYLRSISINSTFRPTPRGIFDIRTLYHISKACDNLTDPLHFPPLDNYADQSQPSCPQVIVSIPIYHSSQVI